MKLVFTSSCRYCIEEVTFIVVKPPHIAVLPFVNRSTEEDAQYFSDGISEEIIHALARIQGLKVISRRSSFLFQNASLSAKSIAQQLGAHYLVEGSVRAAGNRVRISAQLINAEEDTHFWSASWDRELTDLLAVQDEIALLIADQLREQIGHFEIQEQLVIPPTQSTDAYTLALKGKYYFNQWHPESVQQGIAFFQQALDIDPLHLDAHLGLADAYGFLATTGFGPRESSWQQAARHISKALSIHPQSASAYYQLANYEFFVGCHFPKAFQHIQKALQYDPNDPEALQFITFLHLLRGENALAQSYLQRALEVNPLSPESRFYEGYYFYRLGETAQAVARFKELLNDNPQNLPALITLMYTLIVSGNLPALKEVMARIPEEGIMADELLGLRWMRAHLEGDTEAQQAYLAQLEEQVRLNSSFQADSYLYFVYAQMNAADRAFAHVEKALEKKSSILLLAFSDPLALKLQNHSRYQQLFQWIYGKEAIGFATETAVEERKALLEGESVHQAVEQLQVLMEEEQVFLSPNLSLRSLANQMQLNANQLSWLINSQYGINFNGFVNQYRLAYFKELVKKASHEQFSLIGLAYESGFNSKTVFNTYFKKVEGMTPGAYIRRLK